MGKDDPGKRTTVEAQRHAGEIRSFLLCLEKKGHGRSRILGSRLASFAVAKRVP